MLDVGVVFGMVGDQMVGVVALLKGRTDGKEMISELKRRRVEEETHIGPPSQRKTADEVRNDHPENAVPNPVPALERSVTKVVGEEGELVPAETQRRGGSSDQRVPLPGPSREARRPPPEVHCCSSEKGVAARVREVASKEGSFVESGVLDATMKGAVSESVGFLNLRSRKGGRWWWWEEIRETEGEGLGRGGGRGRIGGRGGGRSGGRRGRGLLQRARVCESKDRTIERNPGRVACL